MRSWELFKQAMIGIGRARLRSAITSAGIAIGCGALVSMVAFALGLQAQMEAPFKRLGLLNEIHVTAGERKPRAEQVEEATKAPTPRRLDDAALEMFRALPHVKYAYPELRLSDVRLEHEGESVECTALAAPREAGLAVQMDELLSGGEYFSLDDEAEAIVSEDLTQTLGFAAPADAVGAEVEASSAGVVANKAPGEFRVQRETVSVRIVGTFRSLPFGMWHGGRGSNLVLLPVDVVQQLPAINRAQIQNLRSGDVGETPTYGQVIVRADSPLYVEDVAAALNAEGFQTRTMISRLDDARRAFLFLKSLLSAVGTVALVIAGLGIANTLLMTVLERYQEIGLYKAIGATDGDVRQLFLYEAAALGLLGGIAGLLLAGVVTWGLQWGVTRYMVSQGVEQSTDVFAFPFWLLAGGVAFSVAISVLSGLYPASRAARIEPIEALRRS